MRFRLITLASVLVLSVAASACGLIFVACESAATPAFIVRLADAVSGEPVIVDSIFATATTSGYADTVTQAGGHSYFALAWGGPAGTYSVAISVPGYARWQQVGIDVVMENRCEVAKRSLPISLYQLDK